MKRNLILIGMPASGKSTLGSPLAKELEMSFLDTDDLLLEQAGRPLQEILDQEGMASFLKREEAAILSLQVENTVISTGGSVVYSRPAMAHLKAHGVCVYLQAPYHIIRSRLQNLDTRGVAIGKGQSLKALYRERVSLYETWADVTYSVISTSATPRGHARLIAAAVAQWESDQS